MKKDKYGWTGKKENLVGTKGTGREERKLDKYISAASGRKQRENWQVSLRYKP